MKVTSLLDYAPSRQWDLSFSKEALIHLPPQALPTVCDKFVAAFSRYVMVCEYYNPSPVEVPYRSQEHALFKRDFSGEILDAHTRACVGGLWVHLPSRPQHPLDDSTWFLMKIQPSRPNTVQFELQGCQWFEGMPVSVGESPRRNGGCRIWCRLVC